MKGIDISCSSSQASTLICLNMDQPSSSSASSSSANHQLGGREIDRFNPIIRDERRAPRSLPQSPINPQVLQMTKKGSGSTEKLPKDHRNKSKKKSSSGKQLAASSDDHHDVVVMKNSSTPTDIVSKWARANLVIGSSTTPASSSRYLLGHDSLLFDVLPEKDPFSALVPAEEDKSTITSVNQDESPASSSMESSSSQPKPASPNQVVVLRVSLHCKGCEGKVRKHLSRMEGVKSFNIDFAQKKVTIVGDNITPSSVLESVSKVKFAKFWTSPTPPTAPAPAPAPPSSSPTTFSVIGSSNIIEMVI